jgi:hypothetical protein
MVTPIGQMRELVEGVQVTLPDPGYVVRLRSVSARQLLENESLPNELLPLVFEGLDDLTEDELVDDSGKLDEAGLKRLLDISRKDSHYKYAMVREAFAYPRIVDEPQADDELPVEWLRSLPDADLNFVMTFINAPVREWSRFRQEQSECMEPVSDGEGDAAEAGSDTGDSATGGA